MQNYAEKGYKRVIFYPPTKWGHSYVRMMASAREGVSRYFFSRCNLHFQNEWWVIHRYLTNNILFHALTARWHCCLLDLPLPSTGLKTRRALGWWNRWVGQSHQGSEHKLAPATTEVGVLPVKWEAIRGLIQYKEAILLVKEIPLWR